MKDFKQSLLRHGRVKHASVKNGVVGLLRNTNVNGLVMLNIRFCSKANKTLCGAFKSCSTMLIEWPPTVK